MSANTDHTRGESATPSRLLRERQVLKTIGEPFGRSTLWSKVKAGDFPSPIKIGPRTTVWVEEQVFEWLRARISESRAKVAA